MDFVAPNFIYETIDNKGVVTMVYSPPGAYVQAQMKP